MTVRDTSDEQFQNALATLTSLARVFSGDAPPRAEALPALLARLPFGPRPSPIVIVTLSLDETIRSFPPAAEEMFGYPASEAIGRPVRLILDLGTGGSVRERRAVRGRLEAPLELRGKHRLGALLALEVSIEELALSGEPLLLCALRERPATADAEDRAKGEARYRGLIEQLPAVTFMGSLTGDDIELYVSPQIEALLGFSQREWLSDPFLWYEQLHPDDRDLCNAEFARGCQTGGPFRAEFRALTRKGDVVWIRGEAQLIRDDSGQPVLIQGIAYDITESKRAEQRFRDLLEAAPDAMVIVDARGEIVLVNSETEHMFGYRREELLGQPVELLIPSRFHTIHREHRDEYVASPRPRRMGVGLELYCRCKDGTEIPVEVSLSPLKTDQGTLVVSALRDVTERKRNDAELAAARDAALESARLKSAFLANMSHEIRTPLNVILGHVGLLVDDPDPEDAEEIRQASFNAIRRGSRRLMETIGGILDISKIETGSFNVHPEPVDVASLVEEQIGEIRVLATNKGLKLSIAIESRGATLLFDRYCLSQALTNLLDNAVKFTEAGEIRVRLYSGDDRRLSLEIRDTGVGIDADFLPRLFEPFAQEDFSSTRQYEGSGLGLALVKHYLEMNGASITVTSEKGRGSAFTIHFSAAGNHGSAP